MNFNKYGAAQRVVKAIVMLSVSMLALHCHQSIRETSPVSSPLKSNFYYVSNSGNDFNNGSVSNPFLTINKALEKAGPGDTIWVRGGIYYDKVSFPKSGQLNKPIVLKSYPGELPVIDGSKINVAGWEAMVSFQDVKHISLEGFDICNLTSSKFNTDPQGISIKGNSGNISIRNCNIYNIKNHCTLKDWRSAHAIFVLGNGTSAIKNLTISGCTVHDTQTGTSESVTIAGNVDGFTIDHNKVYDIENIGIIIAGGDGLNPSGDLKTNFARNGVVADNELYNNSHTRSPHIWGETSYGAIAIYVCGGANTIIERNKVYNCDRGIGLVSESNVLATRTCIVRNNVVFDCWRTGIYMGDYLNYTTGGTYDSYVVNNTLYKNNKVAGAFGEVEGELRLTERCVNNVIRNNVVYAGPNDVFVHKYTSTGNNNVIDNNLYYTQDTPQWIWNNVDKPVYTAFDLWKSASGADGNSTYGADPLFENAGKRDFRIRPSSPAKNTGVVISPGINGSTDLSGKPRIVKDKISKGAYQ
ncbi:hypothetical protein [Arcticibacter tournemirensis]